MNFIDFAYASTQNQEPSALGFLLPIFILILMYFILIRPQSKKLKEHKQMLTELKIGDEVATAGGLLGIVIKIGESFVLLKIANNVEIKLQKTSVSKILPKNSLEAIK
ncbi:MAG: preprotein translocase subunit YajC [Gammaproteobacteria bacterium]|nr:preprotein translocase subunit YajC [Gammaproteobacteria bacterium]|tara:strand:+ start:545 stop:868 length:324 start_codon:yes stop_codon:yes gene_type:complete